MNLNLNLKIINNLNKDGLIVAADAAAILVDANVVASTVGLSS